MFKQVYKAIADATNDLVSDACGRRKARVPSLATAAIAGVTNIVVSRTIALGCDDDGGARERKERVFESDIESGSEERLLACMEDQDEELIQHSYYRNTVSLRFLSSPPAETVVSEGVKAPTSSSIVNMQMENGDQETSKATSIETEKEEEASSLPAESVVLEGTKVATTIANTQMENGDRKAHKAVSETEMGEAASSLPAESVVMEGTKVASTIVDTQMENGDRKAHKAVSETEMGEAASSLPAESVVMEGTKVASTIVDTQMENGDRKARKAHAQVKELGGHMPRGDYNAKKTRGGYYGEQGPTATNKSEPLAVPIRRFVYKGIPMSWADYDDMDTPDDWYAGEDPFTLEAAKGGSIDLETRSSEMAEMLTKTGVDIGCNPGEPLPIKLAETEFESEDNKVLAETSLKEDKTKEESIELAEMGSKSDDDKMLAGTDVKAQEIMEGSIEMAEKGSKADETKEEPIKLAGTELKAQDYKEESIEMAETEFKLDNDKMLADTDSKADETKEEPIKLAETELKAQDYKEESIELVETEFKLDDDKMLADTDSKADETKEESIKLAETELKAQDYKEESIELVETEFKLDDDKMLADTDSKADETKEESIKLAETELKAQDYKEESIELVETEFKLDDDKMLADTDSKADETKEESIKLAETKLKTQDYKEESIELAETEFKLDDDKMLADTDSKADETKEESIKLAETELKAQDYKEESIELVETEFKLDDDKMLADTDSKADETKEESIKLAETKLKTQDYKEESIELAETEFKLGNDKMLADTDSKADKTKEELIKLAETELKTQDYQEESIELAETEFKLDNDKMLADTDSKADKTKEEPIKLAEMAKSAAPPSGSLEREWDWYIEFVERQIKIIQSRRALESPVNGQQGTEHNAASDTADSYWGDYWGDDHGRKLPVCSAGSQPAAIIRDEGPADEHQSKPSIGMVADLKLGCGPAIAQSLEGSLDPMTVLWSKSPVDELERMHAPQAKLQTCKATMIGEGRMGKHRTIHTIPKAKKSGKVTRYMFLFGFGLAIALGALWGLRQWRWCETCQTTGSSFEVLRVSPPSGPPAVLQEAVGIISKPRSQVAVQSFSNPADGGVEQQGFDAEVDPGRVLTASMKVTFEYFELEATGHVSVGILCDIETPGALAAVDIPLDEIAILFASRTTSLSDVKLAPEYDLYGGQHRVAVEFGNGRFGITVVCSASENMIPNPSRDTQSLRATVSDVAGILATEDSLLFDIAPAPCPLVSAVVPSVERAVIMSGACHCACQVHSAEILPVARLRLRPSIQSRVTVASLVDFDSRSLGVWRSKAHAAAVPPRLGLPRASSVDGVNNETNALRKIFEMPLEAAYQPLGNATRCQDDTRILVETTSLPKDTRPLEVYFMFLEDAETGYVFVGIDCRYSVEFISPSLAAWGSHWDQKNRVKYFSQTTVFSDVVIARSRDNFSRQLITLGFANGHQSVTVECSDETSSFPTSAVPQVKPWSLSKQGSSIDAAQILPNQSSSLASFETNLHACPAVQDFFENEQVGRAEIAPNFLEGLSESAARTLTQCAAMKLYRRWAHWRQLQCPQYNPKSEENRRQGLAWDVPRPAKSRRCALRHVGFAKAVTMREYDRTVGIKPLGEQSYCAKLGSDGRAPMFALALDGGQGSYAEHEAEFRAYGHVPKKPVPRLDTPARRRLDNVLLSSSLDEKAREILWTKTDAEASQDFSVDDRDEHRKAEFEAFEQAKRLEGIQSA